MYEGGCACEGGGCVHIEKLCVSLALYAVLPLWQCMFMLVLKTVGQRSPLLPRSKLQSHILQSDKYNVIAYFKNELAEHAGVGLLVQFRPIKLMILACS